MTEPLTRGVHHVGLAVPDLERAIDFFVEALGWEVVARKDDYPAAFVSDGVVMVTLWRVADPDRAVRFDRRANVGLHHLALAVADESALGATFERVRHHPGVTVEFAPGPIGPGIEQKHFLCAMPGGLRIEFTARA